MAKGKEFNFTYSGGENQMKARFDLETGDNYVEQNVDNFKEAAAVERQKQEYYGLKNNGYRKFATIPDIVALKILTDHKLDLHDPNFGLDPNNMVKLKKILISEYSDLVINK